MGVLSERIIRDLEAAGKLKGISPEVKAEMERDYHERIHRVYDRMLDDSVRAMGKVAEYNSLLGNPDGMEKFLNSIDKGGKIYQAAANEVRLSVGLAPSVVPKGCLGSMLSLFWIGSV